MTNKFEEKLNTILKKEARFLDQEGDLLTNTIIDSAYKADSKLIELLISDDEIKDKFFTKIKDVHVFNINDFISYIQDKNFLNDSYTKFKNKIGLNIDGKFLNERKEVSLVWPFKDCVLEGGMTKEDEKRKEIFFNEILAQDDIDKLLAPKVLTNWKRYTKSGTENIKDLKRNKNGIIQENLLVKGNNLLALYSLKEEFSGQVKLVYIDPPYNTGTDGFKYNDNFNHSSWLTFMKNRLEVVKDLLSSDGNIFIQIDDNEQAYLKTLCDDIFGRDNFRAQINWLRSSSGKTISRNLPSDVDYILWYSKTENYIFNPVFKPLSEGTIAMYNKDDNDGRGKYRFFPLQKTGGPGPETTYDYTDNTGKKWKCPPKGWRMVYKKLKALENDGRLYFEGKTISEKAYWNERENEGKVANNLWDDIYNLQGSNNEKLEFVGQKPEKLLKRILEMGTTSGDLVLDYHAGTGTTLAVAHKMNRQYIGIEQMNYIHDLPESRLREVIKGEQTGISKEVNWKGGGEFVYCELKKYNEQFIEDTEKAKDFKTLLKIWKEMKEKAFFNYNVDLKLFEENKKEFEKLSLAKQKDILISLLNKNQLYVNLSDIEDDEFKIGKEDKKLNKEFYK